MDPPDPDFAAIVAAAHETTNQVALTYENFDMIMPPGQIDPLPFACMQDPVITHVLQPTDSRLYDQLSSNPSSDPQGLVQMLSIVRVEYKGLDRARAGMNQGRLQVVQQRSSVPQASATARCSRASSSLAARPSPTPC